MARMNDDLCRLLDEQGGVVTSAQALAFLTRRSLEAELKTGELQRVWYGIYGRGGVDVRTRLHGLDLATGTTVAVCLGTAAAVYGFDTEETVDLHVLNPSGSHLRSIPPPGAAHSRHPCCCERVKVAFIAHTERMRQYSAHENPKVD